MKLRHILTTFRSTHITAAVVLVGCLCIPAQELICQGFEGYYRNPSLHSGVVYFAAEGDIWSVPLEGGLASRLTTHPGEEGHPQVSPDGKTLAFTATYEGPVEVYTMPLPGGLPTRLTYQAESSIVNCWAPDGKLVYATSFYSTLPDLQIIATDIASHEVERIPLSQASEATFNADGSTVYFVRPAYHRNVTKRYKGGTARQIWSFTEGSAEAVKLTKDYTGESHHPMWWNNRIYFITDRDGTMNIWSMAENGTDLTQHTTHEDFDIRDADVYDGQVVYHRQADIWKLDLRSGSTAVIPIRLATDLDQLREKWVDNPEEYITSVNLHPDGQQVVITARGRVFVAPTKSGRLVQLSRKEGVRYRDAVFSHDGNDVIVLSDESGEFEYMRIPSSGIGEHKALTSDGAILRYEGIPSPDGKWIAYDDLNSDMWILNIATGVSTKISTNQEGIRTFSWSPDSKWVAFVQNAANTMGQIFVHHVASQVQHALTTDRVNSVYPTWSPDGNWIYFLSDRNFQSLVGSPWGSRQPEPYFDNKYKLYHVALQKGLRSPFRPDDELFDKEKKDDADSVVTVQIDVDGLAERIIEVPVPAGNYFGLTMNDKALFFGSRETGLNAKSHLMALKVTSEDPKAKEIVKDIRGFDWAGDVSKLLVRKGNSIHVIDAATSPVSDLSDSKVDLSGWAFSMNVREDWRQLFTDAWRMERDYFYDPGMHGLDWDAMRDKYLPLVDRVTTRNELSDVIGRFVGELSALHTSVRGGDTRSGDDNVRVASLGARCQRDNERGGYRIEHIYQCDPDYPDECSPLADPYLGIRHGDVITHVNGAPTLSVPELGALLRNSPGKQVRLGIKRGSEVRDVIIEPMRSERNLRYRDWEYTRRQEVEESGDGDLGYLHLRAMGSRDAAQWYREFYPVFDRKGLIIDVRHNNGGNIESWILEKLMRSSWMYWKGRTGEPYWNMQYAFRGHIVVLVDENTASDGEAFADGFRRLGLGTTIGTRTWGGEIWLSGSNRLSDGGIARAPMYGVYGPEGEWLIEGHGFVPDIEVDNLPHATFNGSDSQLDAAIEFLKKKIAEDPRDVPPPPAYPDKSFRKE